MESIKKVTILLPTRNRFSLLCSVLEDLRNQTFQDFSIIISDNGSTDETRDRRHFPGLDITWIRRNPGYDDLGQHYQVLFREPKTELWALAHDDERYSPDWLEKLVSALDQNPDVAFAIGNMTIRNQRTRTPTYFDDLRYLSKGKFTYSTYIQAGLKDGQGIPVNGFLVRNSMASKVPFKNQALEYDLEWIADLLLEGQLLVLPYRLNTYTLHNSNTVTSEAHLWQILQKKPGYILAQECLAKIPAGELSEEERQHLLSNCERSAVNYWWTNMLIACRNNQKQLAEAFARKHLQEDSGSFWRKFVASQIISGWAVKPLGLTVFWAVKIRNVLRKRPSFWRPISPPAQLR